MWILSGDGTHLVNADKLNRVFIKDVGDNILVGGDFGADNSEGKVASLGKYREYDVAKEILVDLAQTMDSERKLFIMPVNRFDVVIEQKIRDSRVKRRGGS